MNINNARAEFSCDSNFSFSISRKSRLPIDTRRTSTLRYSSATKSSASKIVERKRSCSGDRATDRPTTLRRYGSASSLNAMTPQRFMMTPSTVTPVTLQSLRRTTMMSTDRGRRENHENCVRIVQILQRDAEFYSQLNLNAGLKSMTAKQFLQIITYFMHMIGGKTATSNKEFQADQLNGILKFLKMLNCPYMVTKSAMKTPNAPHTFDQLVTLMTWLSEFAGNEDSELVQDESYFRDEELPSQEFTALFSREMETGFELWNKSHENEFKQLKDRLVDAQITAKTNGNVRSVEELGHATAASKQRIEQLNKTPCVVANEQQFEAMQSQYLKYEEMEHNLNQNIERKSDQLAAIEVKWKDRNEDVQRKEIYNKNVQNQIEAQTKNAVEFRELQEKLTVLRISLDERKAEIESIKDFITANEVRSARLMNQKSKAVADYNVHMVHVCQLLNRCRIGINVDPNTLSLDCQSPLATVKAIRDEINKINFAAAKRRAAIDIDLEKLSHQMDLLWQQEQNDNKRLNMHHSEMKKMRKQLKAFEMNKLNGSETQAKKIVELESKLKRLQSDTVDMAKEINELKANSLMLRKQNENLLDGYETKARQLLEKKDELIDRLDESIELVDQYDRLLGVGVQVNGFATSADENEHVEH